MDPNAPPAGGAPQTPTTGSEPTPPPQTPSPPSGSDSQPAAAATGGDSQPPAGGDSLPAEGGADSLPAGAPDPLDVKPETVDGYTLTVSDKVTAVLGKDLAQDPAVTALREAALEKGWTPRQFNERIAETIEILADRGLLQPNFDPAAERAALGENGSARQQELETFIGGLKTRGDIDDAEYGELMSLVPTASGVKALEKLRKMMAPGNDTPAPGGDTPAGGQPGDSEAQAEARALARDPRYETDPKFRREADRKFMEAFGAR
jgi:hypothetical protein